jgi:hypothetical protein
VDQLGGTRDASSRTAIMTIQSSVSTEPFPLILREYKGIDRKNWGDLTSSDLLSGHIDLTIQDHIASVADKLKAINMFRPVNIGIGGGELMHAFGFVQDPDALYQQLQAAGTKTVSEGGIVKLQDGRAAVVQDPDAGGFVELFQPKKK